MEQSSQGSTASKSDGAEMDAFQRGFVALSTGYFDLISRGKARKWASYITDAIAQKRMGFDLPEYDPNYRFRIHEVKRTRRSKISARLRKEKKMFTYAEVPLHDESSTRLVIINPGIDGTAIECNLKTTVLGEASDYEALSYTWGNPVGNSQITVNGLPLIITENLHAFLLRVRSKSEPLTFWIDGICINQADQKERSKQVRLMRDIYASAVKIRIWLGEETDSTAAALSLAGALTLVEPRIGEANVLAPEDIENTTRSLLADGSANWKALDLIYWQAWFSRVWIIQEIALARGALVQCGSYQIPWEDLVAAGRVLVTHHLTSALGIDPSPIMAMQTYREATLNGEELTLLELMHVSRSNRSTDPRDKIYGVLGIAADIGAHHIDPDYELSVEDVYRNLALSFIDKENNVDFLSAVEDYKWRVHQALPSWVPDWTAHPRSTSFLSQPQRWHFAASGDSLPQISSSGSILRIRGKILDTISRVGSADVPMRDNIPGARGSSYFRQTLILGAVAQRQHWENLVAELKTYPTGTETALEAFHHTAIAEGRLEAHAGPDDVAQFYSAWKKHWKYLLNYRLSNLPEHASPEELQERECAMVYTQAWKEAFRFVLGDSLLRKRGTWG